MQEQQFDAKHYLSLITKKKFLFVIIALTVMTAAVVASYVMPKKYEAKSTVFIEKNVIAELVKGIAVTPSMEDKLKVLGYALNSRTINLKVIKDLDLDVKAKSDREIEELINNFQKNTNISMKEDNNLFTISVQNEDPKVARDYVNTLINRYIEENLSSKREESFGASRFLGEQISSFKERVDKAEEAVLNYKREHPQVIGVEEGAVLNDIRSSEQKLDEVRARISHLEALRNVARKSSSSKVKISALQKNLDDLRLRYTENYPEIIRLKEEIEELKSSARSRSGSDDLPLSDQQEIEKVQSELRSLRSYEASIQRDIGSNRALLQRIPAANSTLQELESQKNKERELYEELISRHGKSEVSQQMEVQDKATTFRIVDPAVLPIKPVSPNRIRIILMGIIGGIAIAFGAVFGLDQLDQSVKSQDSLKGLGVPVLAVIPVISNPIDVLKSKKNDLRLYRFAGVYFSVILAILIMEVMDISLIDKLISKIQGAL
ncbi:XrtA system polysaccharide chain length determinant [Geobacter benzoatilyticus]|uniref:Chain-length determining protein n=1 Tax=Geobacter benzoatilyticus TaxID=2815309 RepID=A0ABX7Q0U7_9BACT|nr:XrtA system polysaccharide chain length determinant [Geobacter benzoatilyticus]QSV45026.1 chain-length determining protein [Geobacter benzoatilyticus]